MPINKFTTLLDLSRQAKILSGETATFDGKIQVGIPFSGYPSGVDTGSTTSLGVVSSQTAVLSGDTSATVFDVSNPSSPNYSILFSGFTGSTWSNPLFSAYTSGLTLPIVPLSAETQIVGPFWTLTQTGMTGDYVIGTEYTGYSITYSFFNITQLGTGTTYSGFTNATQENFSAGTLDYKGPLDYLHTKEDGTVEGRLTTNKITITNGASLSTIGYVLTQTGQNGEAEWVFNSSGTSSSFSSITITNLSTGTSVSVLGITSGGTVVDGSDLYDDICNYCSSTVIGDVIVGTGATETEWVNSEESSIDSSLPYSCTQWCYYKGGVYVGSTTDYETAAKYEQSGYTIRCCDGNSSDGGTDYGISVSGLTTSTGGTIPVVITGLTRPYTVKNSKKIYLSNVYNSDIINSNQVSITDSTLSSIELSTLSFIKNSFNSSIYNSYLSGIISSENGFIKNSGNSVIIGSQYSILSGVTGSTIIGGNNITGTTNDTVYVPYLNIDSIGSGTSINNLGIDSNGNVVSGSSGVDFYTTDGTLSSFRIITTNGYGVYLSGGSSNTGFGFVGTGDKVIQWSQTGILNWDLMNDSVTNDLRFDRYDTLGSYLDTPLFIEFSGGNVGVGYNAGTPPTETLDVSGKTKTISLQVTSGAVNGYVLTSDASGNATWQSVSGGTGGVPEATTATTTTINFTGQTIYYDSVTPGTGNISENLTGSKLGLIQKIYHNDVAEPTYPAGWVLLGDAIYFTSTLNIIYAEWAGGSRVEYWYVQEQ